MAVTRSRPSRLSSLLEARGARPLPFPTTALAPPRDPGPLRSAAARIDVYDFLVLTSRSAISPLLDAVRHAGTARSLQRGRGEGPALVAVGPGTAGAAADAGLEVWQVAGRHRAEGVVEVLRPRVEAARARGDEVRILYPRSEGAREVIPAELSQVGARVDAVDAYRTVHDAEGARALAHGVDRGEVDVVTFAAGSAARSFARGWRAAGRGGGRGWPARVGIVTIGPVTARAVEAEGLPVHGTGEPHTLEGLVDAVVAWARERRGA